MCNHWKVAEASIDVDESVHVICKVAETSGDVTDVFPLPLYRCIFFSKHASSIKGSDITLKAMGSSRSLSPKVPQGSQSKKHVLLVCT